MTLTAARPVNIGSSHFVRLGKMLSVGLKIRCECHLQRLTLTWTELAGHLRDGSKVLWNS